MSMCKLHNYTKDYLSLFIYISPCGSQSFGSPRSADVYIYICIGVGEGELHVLEQELQAGY